MEAKSKQSTASKQTTENFIKDIRRKTRKLYSSEQKILIVMEALRGEESVAAICRKHGIVESMFYKWNKEFMEAGKKHLPLCGCAYGAGVFSQPAFLRNGHY